MIRKLLLGTVAGALLASSALAQQMPVNAINQNGVQVGNVRYPTHSTVIAQQVMYTFGTIADQFNIEVTLQKGSTQRLCVNLTGTTITSEFLESCIEWQEY